MTVRLFEKEKDYSDVCKWWAGHKPWQPVPIDHLAPIGFIVEKNGTKLAAAWCYFTGTAFGLFEFLVSNPEAPVMKKFRAIELLIDHCLGTLKNAGVKSVFTSIKNDALERLLVKHGFLVTDREMVNLLARLG